MVTGIQEPFDEHFAAPDTEVLRSRIDAVKQGQSEAVLEKDPSLGRTTRSHSNHASSKKRKYEDYVQDIGSIDLKKRLIGPAQRQLPKFSSLQASFAPLLLNYQDVLYGGRTVQNASELRMLTALHLLNHILKTRDRVIKNNARLSSNDDSSRPEKDFRDQGFTRPKVLVLLETRQQCVRWVDAIIPLSDSDQQENRKRFQDAYSEQGGNFGEEKPEDFRELFDGNDDNDFRLGMKFTRRTAKFYSHFYDSDIIFASPLGLRRAVKADDPKKMDCDFLSSIEICIIDQADAMLMQNWEHVEFVFEHLNQQPQDSHGCDFSRVRQWYLDGHSRYLRQTLILSQYITPELNSLFNQQMQNIAGKVKIQPEYSGSMLDVDFQVRQTFHRLPSQTPASDPEERFKFFTSIVVPSIIQTPQPVEGGVGALVFIPNYYDFVRVRNYFAGDSATQDISFGTFSEYDEPARSQRARSHFLSGKHSVLLYTGRAHHFRRLTIRGVKRIYFYGLPQNPAFYSELVGGYLGETIDTGQVHQSDAAVKVLFSKWDGLALERIVGTGRIKRMLKDGTGDTFDFR
ncbi:MAG: hypothetical protein Q9162_007337 [Coniocarpon cinnabarinum]